VQEQFNLGVADMEAGRFDLARQRFEWVIRQDPGYPNVTEMLALVLLEQNTTATSTPAPTPTLTPTPDLRSVEELYTQSKQLMLSGDWSAAIDSLLKAEERRSRYATDRSGRDAVRGASEPRRG
jgi:predicted Zn-dependent protease